MYRHCLAPHPNTPAAWLRRITVDVHRSADRLDLGYHLHGDLSRLRLPQAAARQATDGLWRHTCCELFLQGGDAPAYREFNFSPSGAWAAYQFTACRARGADLTLADPGIVCRIGADEFVLDAVITGLPPGPWRVGLSAVIEDTDGGLSYWALSHPAEQPDFHHSASFSLELA